MNEATLIVAFDGMDKHLIEKFGLENVRQQEFGRIDNKTGISNRMTSELFASFITGNYPDLHGVEGLQRFENKKKNEILTKIIPENKLDSVTGLRTLRNILEEFIDPGKKIKYNKSDLQTDTFFDLIEDSRAMFVPSYNPSKDWMVGAHSKMLSYGYSKGEVVDSYWKREFRFRKKELFHELENNFVSPRSLLMCHFHVLDSMQHFYGDEKTESFNENKLKKYYNKIDEFAGMIKQKALENGYDRILFMSDHGLPEGKEHNKQAFYSCNKTVFRDRTPGIADFYKPVLLFSGCSDTLEEKLDLIDDFGLRGEPVEL